MFRPVPADVDFSLLEKQELDRWAAHRVFERSVEQRAGAAPWVFYEGPPTANGRPGVHTVWARVYKDLFCRFRAMRGFYVARRAGWDTHGLPVEVEVEKQLGTTTKRQIEDEVGIAEFVRLCRESVNTYVAEFAELTTRIGYWVDLDDAYWTLSSEYVQSVWWHLQQLFDKGLLYEDLKVVPYCPRCGTALSSHELGQPGVYEDEEDESAYVALPLVDPDSALVGDARALVVWTTTPWTLPSNTGVAVHPELTYAVVGGRVVAEALVGAVFGEDAIVTQTIPGADLVGLRYRRPLDAVAVPQGADGWRVVAADYVTTDEGTGLVHLAPAFGEIDRQVARASGLPMLNPVGPDGRFTEAAGWLAGRAVREANHDINDALAAAGVLVRRQPYIHSYPHCWRCDTPLIYWGKPSWYVATSTRKDELVAANQGIDWHPAHIRDGRFGEWLANNVDWALSRDRFWGTPLPIWRCPEGHLQCVGSLAELSALSGTDLADLDPHRPGIDDVVLPCPQCAATPGAPATTAQRVAPVIDAWFDSGSMPAAQVGYPHAPGSAEAFTFPADFISEAIDQTRGWFYSLLAVNQLVFGRAPYGHVVCLGHLVDANGRKMSKSAGNILDPWEIIDTRGADPLRWWMFSQGSPWSPTHTTLEAIDAALRSTLLTLWNAFSFFTTYAAPNHFELDDPLIPLPADRPPLDRWLRSRLATTVVEMTEALDTYDPYAAASALGRLVDDLSNWYVRRSRRRFWRTDPDAPPTDTLAAEATLHETLATLSVLLAPFCPFLADRLWRELWGAGEADSVHLADWPRPADWAGAVDAALEAEMAQARQLSSLGRAARGEAGVKVRQPLARALVYLPPGAPALLSAIVADELNVDEVVVTSELGAVLRFELRPNFKLLGPRFGSRVGEVQAALSALDAAEASEALEARRSIEITLSGGPVTLDADEVELRVHGQPGYAVSRGGGEVVALDLAIDDALRRRGDAREVVRQIQDQRKEIGLEVTDRIRLRLVGLDPLRPHFDAIGREVLAVEVSEGPGGGPGFPLDPGPPFEQARAWIEKA
jgi:isoleucyl-tRNA synthetase